MNKLFASCPGKLKLLCFLFVCLACRLAIAGDSVAPPEPFDYAKVPLVTGTVYAIGSNRTNVLFKFSRIATRSGSAVNVERAFDKPGGDEDVIERVHYESGNMVSFEMHDFPAGLWGTMDIINDTNHPGLQKLIINHGSGTGARGKGVTRDLPKDLQTDDSIYPFILTHWDELVKGETLKVSMVSFERDRAFVFNLRKSTASNTPTSKPAVWLKMTPANIIVARFVNPIYFAIEKDAPHRILEYIGRTAPMTKKGSAWKYVDAETVFDWK